MSMPFEPLGSQDKKDDDGPVIDSFFIETDAPPDLTQALQPILVKALEEPKRITRLISQSWTIGATWDPFLVLPADPNRKNLNIHVYSPTAVATDGVRFSDERGTVTTGGRILHGGDTSFTAHTGAVWALATGAGANGVASAPVTLEIWSVTE